LFPGRANFPAVDDLDCTAAPFPKVAQLIASVETYNREKAAYEQSQHDFELLQERELSPFAQPAVSPSILGPSSDEPGSVKRAFSLPGIATGAALTRALSSTNNALKGDPDRATQKSLAALDDPAHEQQLRMINTQAMLQDMMVNDPVISSYDPEDVAGAYNDIVQLAPRASDQRMLMQTLLRKQLVQGHLDNFEMDQLLGMDQQL
jgi:hypothetical protein